MTSPDNCLDFDLAFSRPAGAPRATRRELGLGDAGFGALVPSGTVTRLLDAAGPRDTGGSPLEESRSAGERLGASLFDAALRGRLDDALRTARREDQRLRVRLLLDGREDLEGLLWEALVDPATGAFLGASDDVTFVRMLEEDGSRGPFPASPLRVLAVVANPPDRPPFDADREWWELQRAVQPLAEQGRLRLELLGEASETALRRHGAEHHVVHFVGYGSSDPKARYGCLFLEGQGQRSRAITAVYLGTLLGRDLAAKLVVLHPGGAGPEIDPFAETARTLVRSGIPAVLAMRSRLSQEAAAPFFATLYRALADGLPIDMGVAMARRTLQGPDLEPDWATPVLYAPRGESLRFGAGEVRSRTPVEYVDFNLKIEPLNGTEYPVLVLGSPAGEGRGSLQAPFPPHDMTMQLDRLGDGVRRSAREARDAVIEASLTEPAIDLQAIGHQLFESIFSDPVMRLFDRSIETVELAADDRHGLRLALHLDPDHPDLVALASLPWELLYSRDRREYLCLSRKSPLVRYLDVPRPARPLSFAAPLRILVACASPVGLPPLALEEEKKRIQGAWGSLPRIEVEILDHASPAGLRGKLEEKPFHALHFAGHGCFMPGSGVGALAFEQEQGGPELLPGPVLGQLLGDFSSLELVLLNACDTARSTRVRGLDPFASVASALVRAGLQAVVAMQFPISDAAALTFSTAFYDHLAAGEPLDAAVVEGRMAIRLQDPRSFEWATPVLFLRSQGGALRQAPGETAAT